MKARNHWRTMALIFLGCSLGALFADAEKLLGVSLLGWLLGWHL